MFKVNVIFLEFMGDDHEEYSNKKFGRGRPDPDS